MKNVTIAQVSRTRGRYQTASIAILFIGAALALAAIETIPFLPVAVFVATVWIAVVVYNRGDRAVSRLLDDE